MSLGRVTITNEGSSSTGQKPFKCEFTGCKATFGDPSSCARHRREIHNPTKPFECPIPGCSSSIRRSSSFRTHLKKHGVDPNAYTGYSKRDRSPIEAWRSTELERVEGGQVSVQTGSSCYQELPLSLPETWDPDQFLSLPVVPSVPIMVMQPELTSMVSSSPPPPLLFAPSSQIAPDNGHYFLSPSRGSPESSSPYSSPMTSTPILTPDTGSEFLNDISIQLSNCLAAQDWTRNAWQDHGLFV